MRELYKKFDSKKLDEVLAKLNKIDMHPKVDKYSVYVYKDGEYEECKKKELYKKINCLIDMYVANEIDMSILLQAVNYLYKNIDEHYITLNDKVCFFFFAFTKIKAIMESKNEKEIQVYNALCFLLDDMCFYYNINIDYIKKFLNNDYVIVSEEFDNENFYIEKYMEDIKKLIMELDNHSFYSYAEKDFKDSKFENINLLVFYFINRPFQFEVFKPFYFIHIREILNRDGFVDNAIEYLKTVRFINYKYHLSYDMNVERLEYIYFWTDDYLALDIFTTDANVYNLLAQYNYFKYLQSKDEKYKDIAVSYMCAFVKLVTIDASMTLIERTKTLFENMFYILFRECESYSDFEVIIYAIALKISDFRYNDLYTYKYKNENGETCYFKYNYNTKKMALNNYYYPIRKNEIEKYIVPFRHTQNNNNEDHLKACKEELYLLKTLCYEFTSLGKDLKDIEKIQKIIDICTTLNINYILKFSKLKFDKYDDKGYKKEFDIIPDNTIIDNTIIYEAIENIKLTYIFYYSRTKAKELNLYLKLNEQIVSYINILKNEKKYDIIEQIIMSLKEYINADDYKNKLEPVLVESLHFLGKYKSCLDIFKEDSFTDYSLIVKLINISAEYNILNTNIKIQNKNIILRIYEILTFSSKDLVVTSLFNFIKHINNYIDTDNNWDGRTVNIAYKYKDFILCYNFYVHNKEGKFDEKTKIAVSQLRNTLTHINNDRDKVNEYIKEYKDAIEFTKTNYSKILECMFNVIKKNNILTRKGLNDLYIF